MTPEQIKELVHGYFVEKFTATMDVDFNDMRLQGSGDLIVEAENALQGVQQERAIGIIPSEYDDYISYWMQNRLKKAALDNLTKDNLHELLWRADVEVMQLFLKSLREGQSGLAIGDLYFSNLQQQISNPINLIPHASGAGHVKAVNQIKPLREAIDEFLITKTGQDKTVDGYHDSAKILLGFMPPEANVSDLDEDEGYRLLDYLKIRPTNLTKLIANNIDPTGRKTLSDKTMSRHWSFYIQFFNWCLRKKYIAENPLTGIKAPKKRASKNDRDPFSKAQIEKLFSSPLFTGFRSRRRRTEPGNQICYNVDYWCTLICYYTGARPGEILQLSVNDIKNEDGIWYFDITEEMEAGSMIEKSLKNSASKRKTPIHDALINAGLLAYVEQCRKAKHKRLFEDALPSKATGYLTDIFSKRINHYLWQADIRTEKTPFYSLRHTFSQAMREGKVPEHMAAELMGHEAKGMTYGVYSGRLSLETLHQELHNGKFPVDAYEAIERLTKGKLLKEVSS